MTNFWVAIISGVLILIGTLGALIPVVPGIPLALAGLVLYALVTHFAHATILGVIVFSILTALTVVVDVFGPGLGAKGYKSSPAGIWGAVLGGVFGIFIFGPLGVLVGPFIGGFLGELMVAGDHEKALKIAWGAFVGQMIGWAFKLSVGLAMLIYLVIAIIKN
jgi:hypothetical protein